MPAEITAIVHIFPFILLCYQSNSPDRHRYKGSPSSVSKITLDEKLRVVKSAVEDLKRKLEILLLEKYTWKLPPGEFSLL